MGSRTALVLFGSETGNAQDVAEELGRSLERLRFSAAVLPLDAADLSALKQYDIILIAVSTTGQGEMPNNARRFWTSLLKKKLSPSFLEDVLFALFGLGDSSYPKYNWAALKLERRLLQLGASELISKGEGDEQHSEGRDSALIPWTNTLRSRIMTRFPLPLGLESIPDSMFLQPPWILEETSHRTRTQTNGNSQFVDKETDTNTVRGSPSNDIRPRGTPLNVVLKKNKRITPPGYWQDVRHIEFLADAQVNYLPGDILSINPLNHSDDITLLIKMMGWQDIADKALTFVPNPLYRQDTGALPNFLMTEEIPPAITLRQLLTKYIDINSIPRQTFFSSIIHFTNDVFQKDRLIEFTNSEFLDEFYDYTTRPRRSILEVLQEFDTVKIPWYLVTTIFPILRDRQFSIASGGSSKYGENGTTRIELLVAIVKYRTVIRKIRRGVCTRYLESLEPGSKLRVILRKGSLGIRDTDRYRPVIMIGPGTGVAPMRSLIWERLTTPPGSLTQVSKSSSSSPDSSALGLNYLFFGCRNRSADFFFEEEWNKFDSTGSIEVFTAFSRDQDRKVYVQDVIRNQGAKVYQAVFEAEGIIYVCGSSGRMPSAVREALIDVFQDQGAMLRDEATAYLTSLEKSGRYKQETW